MGTVKIYLASASPRRLEIMEKIGVGVQVMVSDADENTDITDPILMVGYLSKIKAESVFKKLQNDLTGQPFCVIGADTVVSLDGHIMGKPADEEDAFKMLRDLSGRRHHVYTGVTVMLSDGAGAEKKVSFYEETGVDFCEMSDDEIRAYIATGDPMDKAGAYGIQSYAAPFVSAISGDYYNVMGLPASRLYHELKGLGVL
jgi:septum formation protein